MMLIYSGITLKKAAEMVGLTVSRCGQVANSPAGKAYLQELIDAQRELVVNDPSERIRAMLISEAVPSIKTMVALRDRSDSERIQLNAANSLLDRTVPRKIQQAPAAATFVLPDKIADRLLKALEETRIVEQAIDVSPVPEDPDPSDQDPR